MMLKNVSDCFRKARQIGWRTTLQYIKIALHNQSTMMSFRWNALRYPMKPSRGITLIGHFGAKDSLGKVARDMALRLAETGIPFQTFSLDEMVADEVASVMTPSKSFRVMKYDHVLDVYGSPFPKKLKGVKSHTILFWEFDSGFAEAHPLLMGVNPIAMSDFNFALFQRIYPPKCRVSKLLYPFRFGVGALPNRSRIRSRFNIADDDFVVFFNFDFGSSFGRKNPDGAMRAFALGLRDVPAAKLVFKTMRGTSAGVSALKHLATEFRIIDRFIIVQEYLSSADLYGLTAACDVYLSLHRGEGFGLGIAEAMALGIAPIITAYSAPMEFCNAENAVLVPYRIVPADKAKLSHACYNDVAEWAEPDITSAANALRRLYEDAAYRTALGSRAKSFISKHFSDECFRQSVNAFLNRHA